MSCKIIYNNQNYTIESFKDYLVKNKNLFLQDFISQDIEGFKNWISNKGLKTPSLNLSKKTSNQDLIEGFLADFGINVEEYNNLKDELGIDALSASDLITKSIAYEKGESILPEVAYFAYSMLGKQNNKLRSELRYLINKWDKYQERFNYHTNTIKQKEGFIKDSKAWKNKIRDLVIIDFLTDNLQNYYLNNKEFTKTLDSKWTKEDFSLWNKIISMIEDFLSNFSDKYSNQKQKLENIGLSIADEVMSRNYEYFDYSLTQDQVQKYYKDTIESDLFAKELVEFSQQNLGLILTGSLALRNAGSVYRTSDETLHDIDFVVPYDLNSNTENKQILTDLINNLSPDLNIAARVGLSYVEKFSWFKEFKEKYPSFQVTNGFYGGEHNNFESLTVQGVIDGQFYEEDGFHEEEKSFYTKDRITKKPIKKKEIQRVAHKKGEWVKGTGYAIDFFVRLSPFQEEHENYFKLWKEIMIAKIKMGRDKDFSDWKAFVPYLKSKNSFNFKYEGFRHINYETSFQTNLSQKSAELKALPDDKWFNRTIQPIINRFSKMFPNVRSVVISEKEIPNEVKSIVDGLDKQINSFFHKGQVYIIKERVTKDIAIEEFLHPFINALEQDNPELFKSLLLEAKKLFPELKEEVFTKYGKVYGSIFDLNREFLTQALTKKVSEQTPEQQSFFQKFKSWIKGILNRLFGEEAFTRQLSELDEQMSLTDLASILNENNTQFNFNSDTNTTYYSLNEEEINNYLNRPKNQIQAELLDKILENNKVTQTDFTGNKHEYTRNELGEILQLKPVSSFLSKKINPELDFSNFAQIGNAIHEIVKNINLNLLPRTQLIDTYAEKSDLKKILVDEKGYPIETVKQILSNIYDYVTPLIGSKESLLVSEVSISALQDLGDHKGVAGTIDLLEITKTGDLIIHDFKSMYLNGLETIVYSNNPSTQLTNKFNDSNTYTSYREQLSLYAKMLKGLVGNKNITLQIVPIGYLATSETKDKTIKVNFSDRLVKTDNSLMVENYIYSPFTLINVSKQQTKFQVPYFKAFADKILPSIVDKEEKKITKEEIDRQELLNNLTDKIKGENSKSFETEIEKVFKQITTIVTQYGNSQNELNKELFKIFDPKGELKETKVNFDIIFKNIADKKGDDLKYYLSTLVQYINFIQEINVGLTNIKNHLHVIKVQESSDSEKIAAYRKSYLLAKAQKERISKTLLQLDDISDDNLFKKMIKESIANIKEIEERYFNETLPLTANILNSYITSEFRERMTKELTDRISKEKYDLNLVTSESSKKNINEKIEELEQRLVAFNDPNLITKIIKGEYGDGHWFDSSLVANINNSNYVISGTAVMMQHILQDIAVEAMKMEEKFGKEFRQREEAYGVNRDQVKAMNKDMVTTVQRFFENSDGTIETLDSMQFITKVNQQVYEDYEKLEILYKHAKTDEEKKKALKDIKDFEKLHFESKYNPKYLNALNKLDVTVSDGRNVMEVRQKILDDIKAVRLLEGKEEYKEGNISPENLETLRELTRDLFNLSSSFDRNGNKKEGADLEIAEILQKRSKELEEFRNKKVDEELWKKLKTKKIQSLLEKYNNEEEVLKSEEYKKWQAFNSIISPTPDFYKKRKEKLDKINAILDKKEYKDISLAGQLKDNLNQSWEKLNALSREYRDFEREFISQDIPEGSKKAMKILEENIDKVNIQIKGLEKSLSKDDKKTLNNLWEDYNSMVEYKTSKYYEEDLEIALNKYALENELEVSELRNDSSLMTQFRLNSEWYVNNHITKERYDKISGETIKYTEPVYYYKVVVPTNSDYIKETPAFQYSTFELKPEAYNLDEDGNPNYLDVFGRPKIKENSKYITENIPYLKAKNDLSTKGKINFQNVNFITSELENAQKDLNKNNLVYYQVPSKFKSTFERGSEGDLKSIKKNIVDGLFRMTNDEKEFGTRGVLANLSGEEMQFIPVLGKYKLDFKDQSYDVWQSTLEYIMSAKKAKMFEERLPIFDVLVDQLEKNTPVEDPNKVEAIGNSMAKKFGLNNVTEAIKGKGTNTLQAVKDEISRGVYEEFTKELANWKGISDVKITNTVLEFAGTTMMIGKIANWTVNAMSGNIQVMIEAAGKRYYTSTDVKNAKLELTKRSKEVLEDISKVSDKSLIGQLTDFFDPMKGEFIDNLGNKFSWSKRTNLHKIFFFGKIFGEWEMQMTSFIAMLKAKKVHQVIKGKEQEYKELKEKIASTKDNEELKKDLLKLVNVIDLYDAFEKGEDGVPKLKEGVQFSERELVDFKLKIQGVNKMLNGSYAKIDQTKIEKYSIGKATMFMKKYLIPLFIQRFGGFRGDMELQDVREGHYRIFYNALLTDIKNLGLGNIAEIYAKMNKPPEQGGYTDLQKQAIKKTLAEFAVLALIFLTLALLGYDDDEDDSDTVKFAQYIALKLKREVGLFTPLAATQELSSLVERPFIAMGAVSNVMDLISTIIKLPFNWAFDAFEDDLYYQRKTALWDKGDSKLLSLIYKTAGLQIAITEPEQLLQSYKYSIR